MPTYILLVNLLEKGQQDLQHGGKTREEFINQLKKAGGRPIAGYATFGPYDAVEIIEVPNDEAMLGLVSSVPPGTIKTTTMRAFDMNTLLKK
jgi:uncharacterized protein with GYD domain